MTLSEEWRPVVGYEGSYEVSDSGRVQGLDRILHTAQGPKRHQGKLLALRPHPSGYLQVSLRGARGPQTALVQTLVMASFVGTRPDGMYICHNNGCPTDNRLANLRYDTPSANSRDAVKHGRRPEAIKTHCKWGHAFTPENMAVYDNKRQCLICARRRAAASREAAKRQALTTN